MKQVLCKCRWASGDVRRTGHVRLFPFGWAMSGCAVLAVLVLIAVPCLAKRIPAPEVPPLESGGIRYIAPNTDGRRAYVEAWDIRSGRKLWEAMLFTNRIRPMLEEDVQWVFIKELQVEGGRLIATDERGRRHSLDLAQFGESTRVIFNVLHALVAAAALVVVVVLALAARRLAVRLPPRGDLDSARQGRATDFSHAPPTGGTLLHLAAHTGDPTEIAQLLSQGAAVGAPDNHGETPLHVAARMGQVEATRLLLEAGADVHARDNDNATPLHYAAAEGDPEVVRLLLEHGADPHARAEGEYGGRTPMHFIGGPQPGAVLDVLVAHGGDVNVQAAEGETPLHEAAFDGSSALAEALLSKGADITAKDAHGATATGYAELWRNDGVAEVLRRHRKQQRRSGQMSGEARGTKDRPVGRRSSRSSLLGALWFVLGVASVWGTYWFPVPLVIAVVALAAWSLREILVTVRNHGPISALPVLARYGAILALALAAISAVSAAGLTSLVSYIVLVAPTPSSSAPIIEWIGYGCLGSTALMLVGLVLQLTARSNLARTSAAVVLGAGWLAFLTGAVMPVTVREVTNDRKIRCLASVKSLSMAVTMYLAENDNAFPLAHNWCEALTPYCETDDPLHCPEAPKLDCAFAYNAVLASVMYDALADPSRTIAIFESDSGWNAHGGKELLPDFPRHLGGDNFGFADGHAAWYARRKPSGPVTWDMSWPREPADASLQWQPSLKAEQP